MMGKIERHKPVLLKEVIDNLPDKIDYFFDGTLGHGGHTQEILEQLQKTNIKKFKNIKIIGVDKDDSILLKAENYLKQYSDKLIFVEDSYSNIGQIIKNLQIDGVDAMLLDLGVNIEHFYDTDRGFSVAGDAPLDMRFNSKTDKTASYIINSYSLEQLVGIFMKYGDFSLRSASYIAEQIINERKKSEIATSDRLKNVIVKSGLGMRKLKVIFQCLRIETNDELKQLEEFLEIFYRYLNIGGKCFIITYHSIEDRIVKRKFRELHDLGELQLLTKHVIKPSYEEIKNNRAARSGKMRIIQNLTKEN